MPKKETTQPVDFLVAVERGAGKLGAQIETQIRRGIRDGQLHPATELPSTRELAGQLGVSRKIVVDAYAQLAAEGYLTLRQGARPRVSAGVKPILDSASTRPMTPPRVRYDFQPSAPDVAPFPRTAWQRAFRVALAELTDVELGYGDACGLISLRAVLASYLGRVRGVATTAERIVITSGYSQGLALVCRVLAHQGATRIALEAPCDPEYHAIVQRAGLTPVSVPVDDDGLIVAGLANVEAQAVSVTPAHQSPTGAVLTSERRMELLTWLRENNAYAIEDDYDAEYRYDRAAIGAFQGLDPGRVVYAGTASKTLAPGLRLGWLAAPEHLIPPLRYEKRLTDRGTSHIDQQAFAHFLESGNHDRHLRRMRAIYRDRRDSLIRALGTELPEATIRGIAAGMHVMTELTAADDERAIVLEAERRGLRFSTLSQYGSETPAPVLMLGYGQIATPAIPAGVRELAEVVRETRAGPQKPP